MAGSFGGKTGVCLLVTLASMSGGLGAAPAGQPEQAALSWYGIAALLTFVAALILSALEERTSIYKSMPVTLAAGLVWVFIALGSGADPAVESVLRRSLVRFMELVLIVLVTMTYINALNERGLFHAVRDWVFREGYSRHTVYWLTGSATFLLSPILDNLSAALLMGTVILTLCRASRQFVNLGCINVVVAANAGGLITPFGDFSTLVIWQQGIQTPQGRLEFATFFNLLLPAFIAWLVPALLMARALPRGTISHPEVESEVRRGLGVVALLFLATIATAIGANSLLGLPTAVGMMTGMGYLGLYGYYLKRTHQPGERTGNEELPCFPRPVSAPKPFDIFERLSRVDWDTVFFLYGIAVCVGGLAQLGWTDYAAAWLFGEQSPLMASLMIGLQSAFIENVPATYLLLAMEPDFSLGNWLLATLAIGLGGSLLAIGSAPGIVLLGQSGGQYTVLRHLRWTPAIALGMILAAATHLWINAALF